MIKYISFCLILLLCHTLKAQTIDPKEADQILKEGKMLYRSEMASWYGTDLFLEKHKDKSSQLGGYFSYPENDNYKCVFFSKDENPKIIGSVTFEPTYALDRAVVDGNDRAFSSVEKDYLLLRAAALKQLQTDTIYKSYNNTNLNIIPIINGKEKKVYLLTGPKVSGVVIFGNDYLMLFNESNQLLSRKPLHRNIIPINYSKGDDKGITVHSHLPETGYLITPTDICTLMLYGKFANWKQHYVISKQYVCIWDVEKNDLVTLTKEAWDRIAKDTEEQRKN